MSNCMIGFPNNIDAATLGGGSFTAGLPVTNLQTRKLKEVARTTDDLKTSTFVTVNLNAQKATRALALVNHNFSTAAKYRVRATNEAATTNWLGGSEDVNSWSLTNTVKTGVTDTAPDGVGVASEIADSTSSTSHYFERKINSVGTTPNGAFSNGQTFTSSVFVKAHGASYIRLVNYYAIAGGTGRYAQFDLSNGTVTGYNVQSCKIEAYPGGWYRVSITDVVDNADTYPNQLYIRVIFYPSVNGSSTYIGTGTNGVLVWGCMLNQGPLASYYPTPIGSTAVKPAGYMDSWQNYSYNSGWLDVWPVVYPFGTKAWEDPNWWGGRYSAEETAGYAATLVHLLDQNYLHQYWRIDIDDTTNTANYLQWGRMFMGPVWQPEINMSWGASLAWETDTDVQKSLGGTESFDVKTPYRVQRYKLDSMTRDEALSNAFEIQRRAGIDKELLWISDPDDTVHALRTRFLGRLRTLSPIEYPYFDNNATAFEIKELQ